MRRGGLRVFTIWPVSTAFWTLQIRYRGLREEFIEKRRLKSSPRSARVPDPRESRGLQGFRSIGSPAGRRPIHRENLSRLRRRRPGNPAVFALGPAAAAFHGEFRDCGKCTSPLVYPIQVAWRGRQSSSRGVLDDKELRAELRREQEQGSRRKQELKTGLSACAVFSQSKGKSQVTRCVKESERSYDAQSCVWRVSDPDSALAWRLTARVTTMHDKGICVPNVVPCRLPCMRMLVGFAAGSDFVPENTRRAS